VARAARSRPPVAVFIQDLQSLGDDAPASVRMHKAGAIQPRASSRGPDGLHGQAARRGETTENGWAAHACVVAGPC
jgi:hypothetical protein